MATRKWVPSRSNPDFARNEELENLFVFGYQSKIFADDERATYIEDGHHLIPWMGESTLLIDRSVKIGTRPTGDVKLPKKFEHCHCGRVDLWMGIWCQEYVGLPEADLQKISSQMMDSDTRLASYNNSVHKAF